MSVTIEIDAPLLLPQLLAGLRAGGCSAESVSARACRVTNGPGGGEDAELCELRFYVRAWARRAGNVGVSVRPDA
jgi:hypothetical protein